MPNYSNGKIYTIRFHNSNEIYIGSTTQSLAVRYGEHKRQKSMPIYKLINNKYDGFWNECFYELYENYSCNSREELCKREGEVIRQFKDDKNYDCLNRKIAGRDKNKYYEDNIEKLKEKQIIYYYNNIERVKEKDQKRSKIYYEKTKIEITCDCGSCINKKSLTLHYKSKKHQKYLTLLPTSATIIDACDKSNS
jgi:hypothetical protein